MKYYGALADTKDSRDYVYGDIMRSIDTPTVVDYEGDMSPILNQYYWSSCVAFAMCSVREFQENRERNIKQVVNLSEYFLYSLIQLWPQKGAYLREACKTACKVGITMEKFLPYPSKRVEKELQDPKRKLGVYTTANRFKAKTYVRLQNLTEMMESLTVNGPFIIGLPWLSTWRNTTRLRKLNHYPVLTRSGTPVGRHAVCVCGVDKKNLVFKIRNSWGLGWGRKGYAYIPFSALKDFDAWAIFDKDHPLMNDRTNK